METTTDIFTWKDLWLLALVLLALYGLLHLIRLGFDRYMKQNRIGNRLKLSSKRFELFYIPMAWLILVIGFISIDPIWHGLFLGIAGLFAFPYLKNYVSGLFLKANPMLEIGAIVQNGEVRGLINRITSLGLVLGTSTGEQFVWYSQFEKMGFAVIAQQTNQRLQSVYLESDLSTSQILDVMFDHPVLSFGKKINLRPTKRKGIYLLQFALEQGAKTEDLTTFLEGHGIVTSLTEKFE
ncbi:hypothetical protein ACFOSV_16650 [Algoriphagus namhaensis]|uniref:Uncharacterized protein n=1 Tax=Algoriphagus namhaensis TaxID=915353 RepID=A0ABV8AV05_9BACT